jgi:hypothetical protein
VASFISPVRPIETGPPWNWNPAETFQTAFIAAQENKRAQEKAAIEMELEQILLPVKQKQAALALDKMQFEVERQSLLLDKERLAYREASRGLNGELTGGGDAAEDDFQPVPYTGADAGPVSAPSGGNQPRGFSQEDVRAQMAAADGGEERAIAMNTSGYPPYPNRPNNADESGYNFSLAGSPFEDEPTNPLYNLPTDNLGERIAMGDASSMGAGAPAATAKVADTAPVELALRRDLPLGEDGKAPNMLGAQNPLEQFAEQTPDRAPATEKAQPQSSGDPFYDWSTQTLGPWVNDYNKRLADLSENLASGKIKAPAFYAGRDRLLEKAGVMVGSALPKLDAEQASQYETLIKSEVKPLDALLQVSSARPRKGLGGEGAVDLKALDEAMNQSSYRLTQLLGGGLNEDAPEVKLERENLKRLGQRRLGIKETPEGLFMDVETKRQMIPVYAANNRPFEGREDYDNISAELTDAQLSAGMEGLRSGSKMFVNMNSYAKTKDGRLTSSAFEKYKTDVTEAKKLYGQAVVFDGNKFNITGKGEGEGVITPSAGGVSVTTPYDEDVKKEKETSGNRRIQELTRQIKEIDDYVADIPDFGVLPFTEGSSWGILRGGKDSVAVPTFNRRSATQKQEIAKGRLQRRAALMAELEQLRSGR